MGQVIEFSDWQLIGKAATTVVEDSRRRSWDARREGSAASGLLVEERNSWGTSRAVAGPLAQAFHVVSNQRTRV
jgi:hypothetical protein